MENKVRMDCIVCKNCGKKTLQVGDSDLHESADCSNCGYHFYEKNGVRHEWIEKKLKPCSLKTLKKILERRTDRGRLRLLKKGEYAVVLEGSFTYPAIYYKRWKNERS